MTGILCQFQRILRNQHLVKEGLLQGSMCETYFCKQGFWNLHQEVLLFHLGG